MKGAYRASADAALLVVATLVAVRLCGCGASSQQVASDVSVGLQAAACVLETYSVDVRGGATETEAVADAVTKCGVSAAQAAHILDSHKKASIVEARCGTTTVTVTDGGAR